MTRCVALLAVLACLTGWTLSDTERLHATPDTGRLHDRSLSVSLAVPPQTWPRTWTRRPKAAQQQRDDA